MISTYNSSQNKSIGFRQTHLDVVIDVVQDRNWS